MTRKAPGGSQKKYVTKKCPECYEYMPLDAKACPSCKMRVGPLGKHGMADRLTNWRGYIICIILWIVFAVYIKWAFF